MSANEEGSGTSGVNVASKRFVNEGSWLVPVTVFTRIVSLNETVVPWLGGKAQVFVNKGAARMQVVPLRVN